ncbi:GNAT family N-acetyltransferase [Novosphingobium sp.]|uniref:GNAT family N-acetyltransferase n=1 Tax=Novosphingobium sp. TaxID=1874826 RepID=UPI0038B85E69
MFIRSERLFLRPGWPEDWAELHALFDDEAVVRNLARARWPYRPDDARAFAGLPQAPRHPHFFITQPGAHGARLIGCAGLVEPDDGAEAGTVGLAYWIGQPFWARGFATEAVRALLPVARTLGHRRVVASVFADNPAAARVLAKVGLQPVGGVHACFNPARGHDAPAQLHAIDIDLAGNCNCTGVAPAAKSALIRAA